MDELLRQAAAIERAVAIALEATGGSEEAAIELLFIYQDEAPIAVKATREQWGRLLRRVMGRWEQEGGRPDVR